MPKNAIEKNISWTLPPRDTGRTPPGLYVIATPIGNLRDITLRALDKLAAVDGVVCEDTRVTGRLLNHFGLKKKMVSYNDHSADKKRDTIIQQLKDGACLAMVSDAGTPLISDPGFKLVRDCVEAGVYVTALPGANAPLTALQLSGMPSDQFCFLGFLPPKSAARKTALEPWKHVQASLIVFVTSSRLPSALADVQEVMGDREVAVVREMTKMYEEVKRAPISEFLEYYKQEDLPKGEIVMVIEPAGEPEFSDKDIEKSLKDALKTMSTKEAAAHVAEMSGRPRKEIYTLALEMSG